MILSHTEKIGGRKLLTVLRTDMQLSASMVRRLKQVQAIYVDDKPVYTDHIVSIGAVITAHIEAAEPSCDVLPETGILDILYEDEGLLAVNKPSGLLVHPSRARYTGTLANYVAGYLSAKPCAGRCHAVNRLDRDTSGVVLFAKDSHHKALAAKALKDPRTLKEYSALIMGVMDQPWGTIDLPVKRAMEGNMLRIVAPDGQSAVTHYKTMKTGKIGGCDSSLIRLRLETGRTHQIRVHCLALGKPILGDILYHTEASKALSERVGITAQALHANRLAFYHPLSGTLLDLAAPIKRNDMELIISTL